MTMLIGKVRPQVPVALLSFFLDVFLEQMFQAQALYVNAFP